MGNAVVPYLTPYRETEVSLRSDSLNNRVDLDTASVNVVPTRRDCSCPLRYLSGLSRADEPDAGQWQSGAVWCYRHAAGYHKRVQQYRG